ncbi:unnamed protein product, partial [Ectocarpus sp. 6 AP-2014]
MYAAQNGACAYCCKPLTQKVAECDHIIPVKHGGPTCQSNLHLLCVPCHRVKSAAEKTLIRP